MEALAQLKHVRQSPRKIRKTLDSIRGMKVGIALNVLHFSQEKAATIIEKTLHSAVANYMNNTEDSNINPEMLDIKEAYVNGGPVLKRFRASAMGRASKIRKPSSHLTIVLTDTKA
ncbi:MAG: 50S ribosomal protein L22 [Candidatus Marinimicrobia bacterium]|nr:50S ribosomal protein L22 [Candidatus Neomarinimicrobiota bacterium]MBL7059646.1 50S ribosomal protein L22 [Candidatus Neomarinimicrobiota bacterium]